MWNNTCIFDTYSKKVSKDQESIQSSNTPDQGCQWESDNVTIRHHKREPRCQIWASADTVRLNYVLKLNLQLFFVYESSYCSD